MYSKLILLAIFIVPLTLLSHAQSHTRLTGKVIRILDGDTFEMLVPGNIPVKVRMNGIDAPEKKQAFGEKSKDHLGKLCFGKTIEVASQGKDRYNRVLGVAYTLTGMDINKEMINAGFAWHYKHYSKDLGLAAAENNARAAKRGLWVDPYPVAPWEFRKNRKRKV